MLRRATCFIVQIADNGVTSDCSRTRFKADPTAKALARAQRGDFSDPRHGHFRRLAQQGRGKHLNARCPAYRVGHPPRFPEQRTARGDLTVPRIRPYTYHSQSMPDVPEKRTVRARTRGRLCGIRLVRTGSSPTQWSVRCPGSNHRIRTCAPCSRPLCEKNRNG